jgi:hypothetical protein
MLGKSSKHPEEIMTNLGITYSRATPQSMMDCWFFWNCEDVPKTLPKFIEILPYDFNVYLLVGHGLSQKMAEGIHSLENNNVFEKNEALRGNFGEKKMQRQIGKIEALEAKKEDIESEIDDLSQRFPFYAAMEKMHQHDSTLRRACWDTGRFIEKAVDIADKNGLGVFIVICLPNSDGMGSRRAPWLPTPADLFAKDWMIF